MTAPAKKPKGPPKRRLEEPKGQRPKRVDRGPKELPESYYDEATGAYYVRASDGEFIRYNETTLKVLLMRRGYSSERAQGCPSEVEEAMDDLRDQRYVRWTGAVAGFQAGRIEMGGRPVLITESPRVLEPTGGDDTIVLDFVDRLLGPEQAPYFHGWIKLRREAMEAGRLKPGQALILAGAADTGKSLLGSLVALMFGGRVADPTGWIKGETQFNAHLFASELLLMDDQGSGEDYQTRRKIGDGLKQLVGNATIQCHTKGRTPFTLTPFWVIMVTLNDELENLQVIPPLDRGTRDKLIICKVEQSGIDRPTHSAELYHQYKEDLVAGIGDYLGMLKAWELPPELVANRFSMREFHHPDIVEAIESFSPQLALLTLIREEILAHTAIPVVYSASEIERLLLEDQNSPGFRKADRLLRGPGSTGKYLARLAVTHPKVVLVRERSNGGVTKYRLTPEDPTGAATIAEA